MEESFKSFPLPFVLVLAGYAFILLLDKVMISSHSHGSGGNDNDGHAHGEIVLDGESSNSDG